MLGLAVGQEIEYQIQVGKYRGKHWQKCRGRVVQVTDRHIAIQKARYPDCLALADLISGHAVITSPAMDFSGVRMRNRQEPVLVGKAEPYITWKERKAQEGAETMSMAAKQEMVGYKYNWVESGPRVAQMLAEGKTIPDIARALDYPYHAVRDYIKRHLPDKPKPSEEVCPAGREDSPHPATVPPVNQGSSPLLEREPVELLPGGGLLPNTTTLIAVDGEYQRRIFERFHQQRKKGIDKYGQPLEDNPAGMDERLEHLAQELTDGLMYVEWIKACGGMTFRDYAIAALRTAQQDESDQDLMINGVFGLMGEAGEVVDHYETDGSEAPAAIVECENQRMVAEVDPSFEGYEDAQFIALSREALPYWIERAEAAEAERATCMITCPVMSDYAKALEKGTKAMEKLAHRLEELGEPPPGVYATWVEWAMGGESDVD